MGPTPDRQRPFWGHLTTLSLATVLILCMDIATCGAAVPVALVLYANTLADGTGETTIRAAPLVLETRGRGKSLLITGSLWRGTTIRMSGGLPKESDIDRVSARANELGARVVVGELRAAAIVAGTRDVRLSYLGANALDECARWERGVGELKWALDERPTTPGRHKIAVTMTMSHCASLTAITVPLTAVGPQDIGYKHDR